MIIMVARMGEVLDFGQVHFTRASDFILPFCRALNNGVKARSRVSLVTDENEMRFKNVCAIGSVVLKRKTLNG